MPIRVTGCHNHASENDVAPHFGVDHTIGEFARFACHHVIGRRVDAHGERGRGIGEQVNPQQLRGEQRHNHALAAGLGDAEESGEHHPTEHSEHFAHIGAQQVAAGTCGCCRKCLVLRARLRRWC